MDLLGPLVVKKVIFSGFFSGACTSVHALEKNSSAPQAHPQTRYLSIARTFDLIRPLDQIIWPFETFEKVYPPTQQKGVVL